MQIDLSVEEAKPLSVLARSVPNRSGKRGICASTIWRWSLRGIRGVRLETVVIGGIRMSTDAALSRFFVATTAAANGEQAPAVTGKRRAKEIEAAEREFE